MIQLGKSTLAVMGLGCSSATVTCLSLGKWVMFCSEHYGIPAHLTLGAAGLADGGLADFSLPVLGLLEPGLTADPGLALACLWEVVGRTTGGEAGGEPPSTGSDPSTGATPASSEFSRDNSGFRLAFIGFLPPEVFGLAGGGSSFSSLDSPTTGTTSSFSPTSPSISRPVSEDSATPLVRLAMISGGGEGLAALAGVFGDLLAAFVGDFEGVLLGLCEFFLFSLCTLFSLSLSLLSLFSGDLSFLLSSSFDFFFFGFPGFSPAFTLLTASIVSTCKAH